jgi:hypothetical protein
VEVPPVTQREYVPKALNQSVDVGLTPKKADVSHDQIIVKSTPLPEMNDQAALSEISFFYEDG